MEDLINRLKQQAGLTDKQAIEAIEIVKDFTKEKFPVFAGAIDNLFEKHKPSDKEDYLD